MTESVSIQESLVNQCLPLDKNNRQIMLGDRLKVFHFATKQKKYFMYKQVIRIQTVGGDPFYRVSHLCLYDREDGYWLPLKQEKHDNIEIIQSETETNFENRKKIKL